MFQKDSDSETEVELSEEDIKLNEFIASLSFLDRATYRKNVDLIKKYALMEEDIKEKQKNSKLSLKETIVLLDKINQEYMNILPLEAIHLQHKKIVGGVEPQEHSTKQETPKEQFDIYLTAIQIEVEQIKGQMDRVERRNKVGKYAHLKKEKKKQASENVIDLDALDQELAHGMPIEQQNDDEVNFDIDLPERLQKKRNNRVMQGKDTTTGVDDLVIGAAIVGAHGVIPLDNQDLENMRANQNDNQIRIVDPNDDREVHEEMSQSKFKSILAKAKYLGAEGLVFAGILEKEDLPENPFEEEKEPEEEMKKESSEDEDEDSASDEEEDGDGGKKKKKKGHVEEEDEEELPDDY